MSRLIFVKKTNNNQIVRDNNGISISQDGAFVPNTTFFLEKIKAGILSTDDIIIKEKATIKKIPKRFDIDKLLMHDHIIADRVNVDKQEKKENRAIKEKEKEREEKEEKEEKEKFTSDKKIIKQEVK